MKLTSALEALCIAAMAALLVGCEPPDVEPLEPRLPEPAAEATSEQPPEAIAVEAQRWLNEEELPLNAWYVQYADGQRIGYYETQATARDVTAGIKIASRGLFQLPADAARLGFAPYEFHLESLENAEGQVESFDEVTTFDGVQTQVRGQLAGDRMTITISAPENSRKTSIKWSSGTWGVLGIQSMLLADPIGPGEKRQCQIFVPKLAQIVNVELSAGLPEITSLPGGSTPELIPIDVIMQASDGQMRSRNWINQKGHIEKTVSFGETMISTFRAPREVAERVRDEIRLGVQLLQRAELSGNRPALDAESAVYLIEGSKTYNMFDQNAWQQVESLTALKTRVTVLNPASVAEPFQSRRTGGSQEAYLQSSPLIPTTHSSVEELASGLSEQAETGPAAARELALALADRLSRRVVDSEESASMSNALETARGLQGDFKAQAILLTAVLRNRGIPARLAAGLKISPSGRSLHFYMWTEAWCEDLWLPIDAAHGKLMGVDYLKMIDTPLAGTNPYMDILPVYENMQGIRVSVE
jgi:hypothetical protein